MCTRRTLPDQWIDVTAVPPGDYWLECVVDPENYIEESNETNNANRILITYAGAAPPNNNFASATVLTGSAAGTTGKTHLGTKEAGEPNHAGNAGGKSVWYRWTAPASGPVTVSTEGSDFDTLLAVYTGTAVGSLTTVGSNDDADAGIVTSRLTFSAVSGTLYRIALDGKDGAVGSCEIAINPASNDLFAASRPLTGSTGKLDGQFARSDGGGWRTGPCGQRWSIRCGSPGQRPVRGRLHSTRRAAPSTRCSRSIAAAAWRHSRSSRRTTMVRSVRTSRVVFTAAAGATYRSRRRWSRRRGGHPHPELECVLDHRALYPRPSRQCESPAWRARRSFMSSLADRSRGVTNGGITERSFPTARE